MVERRDSAPRRKGVQLASFLQRLRDAMRDSNMSQADLARQLEIGDATVSEWFTRGRAPQGDVLLRLPHILAVNGHWLLTGEGSRDFLPNKEDPYAAGALDVIDGLGRHLMTLREKLVGSQRQDDRKVVRAKRRA